MTLQNKVNVTIIATILFLNLLDIYNTLYIVRFGGEEVNPFMKYFLDMGVEWFIVAKMIISTCGLLTIYYFYDKLIIINNIYKNIYIYILILYITLIIYQYYIIYILIG